MCAWAMAGALMLLCMAAPGKDAVVPAVAEVEPVWTPPERIIRGLPEGNRQRLTISTQRLLQGKMLLVDEAHPIPQGVEPVTTLSVLGFARGRIGCRDQQAVLGKETLLRLEDMCVDARNSGVSFLTVFAGTRSQEQQRQLLLEKMDELSRDMPMEAALALAKQAVEPPGCAEHQLPWSVDMRICWGWNLPPRREAFEASPQGTWVAENCWRYGFIRRWPQADPMQDDHRPYCLRYVGNAHAALMQQLDVCLEDYLALLRKEGALTLLDENGAPTASAVCLKAGERHTVFEVGENVVIDDASLDNTGYAVLAITYR